MLEKCKAVTKHSTFKKPLINKYGLERIVFVDVHNLRIKIRVT